MMSPTQKDIAERLGVSRQLVNFAINGGGTMSEKMRHEIMETASSMGYRRNELARAVATGRSRTLGVLTSTEVNEGLGRTIVGALEEAAEDGYSTKLMYLAFDADEAKVKEIVERCAVWQLDGLLVLGLSDIQLEIVKREMRRENRLVAFAGNMPPEGVMGAYSDSVNSWRLAVRHLVELGHRRIAHLGADPDSKLAQERHDTCVQVLREFDIPVTPTSSTYAAWVNFEATEKAMARLLDVAQPPTALLCSGDALAMFAIRILRNRGIRVPEQMSVIGYGGQEAARFCDPPLTTIAQPHEEVARCAVRQLLNRLEGKITEENSSPVQAYKLTTGFKLIVRESTARCP